MGFYTFFEGIFFLRRAPAIVLGTPEGAREHRHPNKLTRIQWVRVSGCQGRRGFEQYKSALSNPCVRCNANNDIKRGTHPDTPTVGGAYLSMLVLYLRSSYIARSIRRSEWRTRQYREELYPLAERGDHGAGNFGFLSSKHRVLAQQTDRDTNALFLVRLHRVKPTFPILLPLVHINK